MAVLLAILVCLHCLSDESTPLLVGGLGRGPVPLVWLVGVAGGRQRVVAHLAVDRVAPACR